MADQHLKNENDDYTFLQEKIKERPINKKKVFKQSLLTISLAISFALVACVIFFFFQDSIVKMFSTPEEPMDISIDLYDPSDEILPEDMLHDEDKQPEPPAFTSTIDEAFVAYEPAVSDLQTIYYKMRNIAQETNRSLVTVTGVQDGTDWLLNSYENHTQTTGIIINDNGSDLLILINSENIVNSKEIIVTFFNTQEAKATLKSNDEYNHLAIVTVPLDDLHDTTKSAISYAELGNSAVSTKSGDLIIATGDPYNYGSSIAYGMVTSTANEINSIDKNFSLITTDIYGSPNSNGVLVSQKGKIIGIIDQSYNSKEYPNQVSAIGITEIKGIIENLCNEKKPAHIGVYVTNVTTFAKQYYNIPTGAYVTNLYMDSPAMKSGIRKGDVIVAINDAVITNVLEYENELANYNPNDDVVITIMRPSGSEYSEMDVKLTLSE